MSSQAEALVAAQREGAAIGTRASPSSRTSPTRASDARTRSATALVPVDSPAVERLHDVASRLILAAEAPERRLAGLREDVRPETLVRDLLVSPTLGLVHPPDVVVAPGAEREFELNKSLVERVLHASLLVRVSTPTQDRPRRGRLATTTSWSSGCSTGAPGSPGRTARRRRPGRELAQVSRLVTALGGTLTVRRREPEGTVVEVRLAARSGAGLASSDADGEARRVLVVDDNSINRRLAAAMLGRAGLETDVVDSGTEALAAMAERRYGLVLMDVQMPGLDGRETTRAWRRGGPSGHGDPADVPIVALTAHVGQDERDACDAGGDGRLPEQAVRHRGAGHDVPALAPGDQAGSGEAR